MDLMPRRMKHINNKEMKARMEVDRVILDCVEEKDSWHQGVQTAMDKRGLTEQDTLDR